MFRALVNAAISFDDFDSWMNETVPTRERSPCAGPMMRTLCFAFRYSISRCWSGSSQSVITSNARRDRGSIDLFF